jgi:hypothetical protein
LIKPTDIWWQTGQGRRYLFRLRGDDAGVTIEENGPLRAVVRAVGWYYDEANRNAPPIARGELRAEFYKGQNFFQLYHTVTYAGDPWNDTLAGYGVRFSADAQTAPGVNVELDGRVLKQPQNITLQQAADDLAVADTGRKEVARGRKASGVAALGEGAHSLVVYHQNLWKMYPKQVEADGIAKMLAFDYWPLSAGPMSWRPREDGWLPSSASMAGLAVGASRTHDFIIEDNASRALTDYPRLFDEPVLAVVPPRYLCATGAMLHLQPYDPQRVPQLEKLIREGLDSYILNQDLYGWYGEWDYGSIPNIYFARETRWADSGRTARILNEQDICQVPWLAFLRSGDRKYYNFAVANTRHLLEVSTIRIDSVWPEFAGMSRRHHECMWLGTGDYAHSMLDPFMEMYHVTGYQPAWEACERMAHAMSLQRDGQWRYISNPIAGQARMYLETQNPIYKEGADRIWNDLCAPDRNAWWGGDHGNRMVLYYSQLNSDCDKAWKGWTGVKKDAFQGLDVLAALHQQTSDSKYAKMMGNLFREYRDESQTGDPDRKDPTRWGIAFNTQFILEHIREMCYASQALSDPAVGDLTTKGSGAGSAETD